MSHLLTWKGGHRHDLISWLCKTLPLSTWRQFAVSIGGKAGGLGQLWGRAYLQQRWLNNGRSVQGFGEAFLFQHRRTKFWLDSADLSTRWQSWVDSNFCFLLIKISIKFILRQEKVRTVTYVSLSYFVLYYLWMSYISPNLHLHLWVFKTYLVRRREACCNIGVSSISSLSSHPNTRTRFLWKAWKTRTSVMRLRNLIGGTA